MAKKFGKFLLFVSTVGAAFAGAYYFMKSKNTNSAEEDDYDDLDNDSYEVTDDSSDGERSYVSLNPEGKVSEASGQSSASGTTVEEFFDDDDEEDGSLNAI
ncbi:MAG: hypothetical protein J6C33_01300 [Lachnospiraceae bacterium]|nr:hypothetical protein [Lachnospiraceae bacterium]